MTVGGPHAEALASLEGVEAVAMAVQGVLLHEGWAQQYNQELTPARRAQAHLRPVRRTLDAILEIDAAPLGVLREPTKRGVGVCRHFAVMACAALRAQGVPARARCGFGMYFEAGKGLDHWIAEYWDGQRWVSADFQVDSLQHAALKLDFDPLDQPPGNSSAPAQLGSAAAPVSRTPASSASRRVRPLVHRDEPHARPRGAQQYGNAALG